MNTVITFRIRHGGNWNGPRRARSRAKGEPQARRPRDERSHGRSDAADDELEATAERQLTEASKGARMASASIKVDSWPPRSCPLPLRKLSHEDSQTRQPARGHHRSSSQGAGRLHSQRPPPSIDTLIPEANQADRSESVQGSHQGSGVARHTCR